MKKIIMFCSTMCCFAIIALFMFILLCKNESEMSRDEKLYEALQSYNLSDDIIMHTYQDYTYALSYNKNSLGENVDGMALYVKKNEVDQEEEYKLIKHFDTHDYTCDYEDIKKYHRYYFKNEKLYLLKCEYIFNAFKLEEFNVYEDEYAWLGGVVPPVWSKDSLISIENVDDEFVYFKRGFDRENSEEFDLKCTLDRYSCKPYYNK